MKYQAYGVYKDSGVEWLGDVPRHWGICRLKNLASIKNGHDYKAIQTNTGFPVMGSGGQFTYASQFMYDKPSVLLGRKGTIDKPLFINEPFWTVDTMFYTEMKKDMDAKYLYYLALTIQFSRYSTNTALPSMTQEHLGNYHFSVPNNYDERRKITNFLDYETAKIDTLIDKQQQLINLMQERRTALISAAVTGKIDVRRWENQMKYNFEWNPIKAKSNLKKHKVSFEEATEVFLDPLQLTIPDNEHNETEERWITLGNNKAYKLRLVVHTYVTYYNDQATVRIISARPATKHELKQYEA